MRRRSRHAAARLALLALGMVAWSAHAEQRTLRIGYQKYGTLVLEKARGTLEKRLAPLGVSVAWTEFLGGPALLEAMGAESIDFGITGDAPPIFAQAAGVPLVYVGVEPASPHGEGILVLEGSPIRTVADLKGKRIALNRGSNVHNLLVQVLAANGLSVNDVTTVFLKPSDARPAFENGSVDAWVIWDPYYAAAQTAIKTRAIADGVGANGKVIDENREYFLATRDFNAKNPDIVKALLADLAETEAYASQHHTEMVKLLAPAMGMDPAAVKLAIDRLAFGVQPMTDTLYESQQNIADTFEKLNLIPTHVDISEARPTKGS
jgi:sulfonate transport system substrate-binding protein